MRGKIKFLLFYLFAWTIFFQFTRIVFLIYHFDHTKQLNLKTILLTAGSGFRMDISMAAYFVVPVVLFVLLSIFIPFFRRALLYNIYTCLLVTIVVLITFSDLEMYNAWGFRIDPSPLKYLATPKEAWASVSHLPLFLIAAGFIIFTSVICFFATRFISKMTSYLQVKRSLYLQVFIVLAFGALLIIPIRGGFQLAPINQSSVYFSKNNFANQAALNASWNLMHGFINKSSQKENPYNYFNNDQLLTIVDSLYRNNSITDSIVLHSSKPNVVFIIWESFTSKAIDTLIEGIEVTPGFNKLKKEGLFFSNLYASGDRTDKGLSAVLSGYPALPKTSIIRTPVRAAQLPSISKSLKASGYATSFYYGGETEFANIKSYIYQSGFDFVVDQSDFPRKFRKSKWGAHDGIVKDRLLNDIRNPKQPFFTTWLTLTSHEPFEIPTTTKFAGDNNTSKFLASIHYSDSIIYRFVEECKKQPWWNNTLMVIVADHGHVLPETGKRIDNFKIPMLWLGGALNKSATNESVASQLDIAKTLMQQLGIRAEQFHFSKNLFSSGPAWAFFSFNNGFGFVSGNNNVVFDNVGKSVMEEKGDSKTLLNPGKAMQQFTYQDFIK